MEIKTSPQKVHLGLLFMIGLLILANIMVIVSTYLFEPSTVYGLFELFHLSRESNIPTLFSSVQLVFASLLLATIAVQSKSEDDKYTSWFALAAIFLFLAIDETAQIHDRLNDEIRTAFGLTGLFYYGWVIPYGIAVIVFVFTFSGFLLRLPQKTMWRFIISGAIYVTGAIGIEMVSAIIAQASGSGTLSYRLTTTVEESFEMIGIALFIYALLMHISDRYQRLRVTIEK